MSSSRSHFLIVTTPLLLVFFLDKSADGGDIIAALLSASLHLTLISDAVNINRIHYLY